MALKIYDSAGGTAYSQSGDMTNPFRQSFDGRTGQIRETQLFIRNDDAAKTYTSVTIQPVSVSGRNIVDGTNGYSWKLKLTDTQPTDDEWTAVTAGASMSVGSIEDNTTYTSFWVRREIPRGAPVESVEGVVYRISGTEYP